MNIYWILIAALFLSFLLTWVLRRYALAKAIIDIPNERSSHSIPTPRGGGVAIVISFLGLLTVIGFAGLADRNLTFALLGAGISVALLGFLDDHGHVAAGWRLLGHLASSAWVLFWLGSLPRIDLLGFSFELNFIGYFLFALYLTWLLNLYNFMDGIDGIASVQAITVCLSGAFLYFCLNQVTLAVLPLLLASSVAGFLFWNFPPAKIFMGDAGSGFLGIVLATLSLQAGLIHAPLLWSWIILLGVFIVDATITLLHRLVRGEKVYEAHRSHAYQFASRQYRAHKPVTLIVGLINCLWLLPWAYFVAVGKVDGIIAIISSYIPLVILAFKFKAGSREIR